MLRVAMICAILALEIATLGFSGSSLRRLLRPGKSELIDMAMLGLQLAGVFSFIIWACSGGLSLAIQHGAAWLASHGPHLTTGYAALDVGLFLVAMDFIAYWRHRLQHTKLWWLFHKVHHSAAALNPIVAVRTHPLDGLLDPFIMAVPLALLLAHPGMAWLASSLLALYSTFLHSAVPWNFGWFGRWVYCSPAAHRIHHSPNPADFNRNFSAGLVIWDRMFGTWRHELASP